ncbi:hypothetical protein [Microbacterium binotii]|uniref:hypothetical protein n=1 Tax=Microbacterium binotii TaxID=462710 RepID=UPI001F2711EF|nr:hypothetical protein [Microbacterium binotii]UIN30524.1 hypothetical protein LXM64_15480 [Microbacterium binotii]
MSDPNRLVICGSMRAYDTMQEVHRMLVAHGVDAILPEPDALPLRASTDEVDEAKRSASKKHFDSIRAEHTYAVLVVNVDKDGELDYIGPNAFAEIAVAFASDRRIYLWQGSPRRYSEELRAWGATELHGELAQIETELHRTPWRRSLRSA